MITTARQLKDLIRNLSKKKSADAQILMRNYTGNHLSRHCYGIRYGSGMRDEHHLDLSERRIYQHSVYD